ncbi:hypothetical protein HPO96_33515 [Kribbella sandramycini]|uniref:Uncharacterized protein n=1 Tax=Kribbella sandramycini TaxID=60450 RepID=A0A7Y4L6F8_9ACTN|nr:hypothetical protein [Kribbella sandramycini]MBB6570314.1 hypothetical protein [Kribbella sandramycini]NOL45178.1 hypothetical protein [Kribbella sandramycini]
MGCATASTSWLQLTADAFTALEPTGNPAADRLTAQYKTALGKAVPKIEALAGEPQDAFRRDDAEAVRVTRQLATLITAIKPAGPDLAALVKTDPMIALAYRRAPTCKPAGQALPIADDGQNYAACADGTCVVLIKKSAAFTVRGTRITVSVAGGTVSIGNRTSDGGGFSTNVGGKAGWGSAGSMTNATPLGLNGSTAVLRIT